MVFRVIDYLPGDKGFVEATVMLVHVLFLLLTADLGNAFVLDSDEIYTIFLKQRFVF
jgi:hypothetical protein